MPIVQHSASHAAGFGEEGQNQRHIAALLGKLPGMNATMRRKRRTPEERIQDLQKEIERLKARAEVKQSPARKQARLGLRSLEKALPMALEESDAELARVLEKATNALSTCLTGSSGENRVRRTAEDIEALAGQILGFLVDHPKASVSEIGAALEVSTKELRGVLLSLLEDGSMKKEGERRGTRYSVTAKGRKKV